MPLRLFALLLAFLVASPWTHAQSPARVDVVTFNIHTDGEDHKLIVTPSPTLVRVDAPSDGYSIIYRPATQYYIGLENRNYTYWEFSWPEVKLAVENTKRYENRLREVGSDGMTGSTPTTDPSLPGGGVVAPPLDTNIPTSSASPPVSDDSGYIWHPTTDKKRIAGVDCIRWTGESLSNGPAEAWCSTSPLPAVQAALTQLHAMNDPIALVPVRNLVPSFIFEVNASLNKGGLTPLLISWGDDPDKNLFQLISIKSREAQPSFFTVPKLYVKTTLVTMDGIGNQKPQEGAAPIPATPTPAPLHLP